jgi:hypothetical protein
MTWTTWSDFIDGDRPTSSDFNTLIRDNLIDLYGNSMSVVTTVREAILSAVGFANSGVQADHACVYTDDGDGASYRFVNANADSPSVIATGQKVRLIAAAGEADGGTRESLGYVEMERTGSGAASLVLETYSAGAAHTYPALKLASDGKVYFGTASGAGLVNVGGQVRAAAYKQAGSGIGLWTLGENDMQYDGDAEVTGQLQAGAEDGVSFIVDSQTVCVNLNAAKMRGQTWPAVRLQATTSVPVTLAAGFGYPVYTQLAGVTAPVAGYYQIDGRINTQVKTGHLNYPDAYIVTVPGDKIPVVAGAPLDVADGYYGTMRAGGAEVGEIVVVPITTRYRAEAGEVLWLRASNLGDTSASVFGTITATWMAPNVDLFVSRVDIPITFAQPTLS